MKKISAFLLSILLFTTVLNAQDKPIRIGVKLGVPNIVGLNFEYVTPLLGAKLAPTIDLSSFSIKAGDVEIKFSYFEIGSNYYFLREGKGLYGHFSYGRLGFKGTYSDPTLGEGEGKLGINTLNFKIGAKWGGLFYFRPEIGYAALIGDQIVKVEYFDPINQTTVTEEEDVPGFLGGGIVFNIGFGFSF